MTSLRIFPRLVAALAIVCLLVITGCAGTPAIAVSITPGSATLIGGASQTFTATVTNDTANAGVNWTATTGTITATGAYTAPAVITTASATITATSKTDGTKSATATVTLTPISVTITTVPVAMIGGATQTFAATVAADGASAGVTWTASIGSITVAGVYTAPAVITTASATITATSKTDPTKSANVTVTLTPISVGAISPASVTLNGGGTQAFTVTVSNDGSSSGVTWSIGAGAGTLSNVTTTSVTYTAPAVVAGTAPSTVSLVATSIKDPTKSSAAATITLNPIAITITTSTTGITLDSGQTMTIAASVTNDSSASGAIFSATGAGTVAPTSPTGNTPTTVLTATGAVASSVTVTAASTKDPTKVATTSAITINPTLTITTPAGALTAGTTNTAYAGASVATSGGTGAKTYAIASGSLPGGLTLDSGTGAISGTITGGAGVFSFTVKATDSATTPMSVTSGTYTITVTASPLVWTAPTAQTLTYTVGTAIAPITLSATGGTGTVSFSLNSGTLPAGLTLTGNVLSGTPTAPTIVAGNAITFLATDSATVPVTAVSPIVTLVVNPITLAITSSSLPTGVVGASYSYQFTSTGGTAPINWTLTGGSLAGTGLTLSTSGLLSGTPLITQAAVSLTFQAKDSATNQQQTKTVILPLTVTNALTVTTTSVPNGFVGTVYSQMLAAAGGSGTGYTWTVTSGTGLSAVGLSLSTAGVISGTPTVTEAAGSFTVKVTDSASNTATATLALTVNGPLGVTTATLPSGAVGTAYSQSLVASGGSGTGYTWTITSGASTLTAVGLNMSAGGVISGTPTATGTANFTVKVTDSATNTATANLSLTVNAALTITTSSLPNGTVGTAYSSQLIAGGGTGTGYTWTVTSGTGLSAVGLSLSSGGLISGTPTSAETAASFTVKVTDSGTNTATATLALTVNAATAYSISGVITSNNCYGPLAGITVSINTTPVQTVNTNASGVYSFNVPNGTYIITPSIIGPSSAFYPSTQTRTVSGSSINANFNATLGYTVSGTVAYAGSKTGRIYLSMNSTNCGASGTTGTSISAAGTFTINGVQPGTYTLSAFMDNLGNGAQNTANPSGVSGTLNLTNAGLTGTTVTLTDPATTTLSTGPSVQGVGAFNTGVIVQYKPITNSNGIEMATSYTLQWSTTSTFTAIAGSKTFSATGTHTNVLLLNGLTNGTVYYFRMYGTSAGTATSPFGVFLSSGNPGAVTIGAPTGGNAVSGAITFTGTATGPLYTGFYDQNSGAFYGQYIANPVSPQAFTIQVPTGSSYFPVGVLDQNNDGVIDAGDLQNVDSNSANIAITGNTTGQNLTLPSTNGTATITTSSYKSGTFPVTYNVNFQVLKAIKLPVAVTLVSGPNVNVPLDIALCINNSGCGKGFQLGPNLATTSPTVGDTYTFNVTYSDGTTGTLTATVSAVLSAFATNLLPQTGTSASTTPTFTWTDPASASSYTYQFYMTDNNGNTIWQIPGQNSNSNGFASTITSIPWITSGNDVTGASNNLPSVTSLSTTTNYTWQIQVQDANGNSAVTQVNYQP